MSEGTRLRLPWAAARRLARQNPERVLALLELLKDDASTMVRRSVANNLNDLGKVRPDLLIRTAGAWLEDASPERRSLVEHALRSAVKRGDADALRLLGYGQTPRVSVEAVTFVPRRVRIGGRVAMTFGLKSTSTRAAASSGRCGRALRQGARSGCAQGVQAEDVSRSGRANRLI